MDKYSTPAMLPAQSFATTEKTLFKKEVGKLTS